VDRSYYSDWGDPREFTLADMGVGECAGEVVSQAEFALAASERELFEAQLLLDAGHSQPAAKVAYGSMVRAAQGLVKDQNPNVSDNENQVITEFTRRFYDTQLFWDKYAGGKFAEYLFKAREFIASGRLPDADRAVQLLQEAQLFIDAAHDCHNKLRGPAPNAAAIAPAAQPSA
jgi:sulfite reductase (ferredoxin)